MRNCIVCGTQLEDENISCPNCGSKIEEHVDENSKDISEGKSNNKFIALAIIIILVFAAIILFKEPFMYKYYIMRGDKEESIKISLDYYKDALEIHYSTYVIGKIGEKIKKDDNFERTLLNLENIIKDRDLKKLYLEVYVNKAEESFNNKNYELTWKYLLEAEKYNYDIEIFKYYNQLTSIQN